MISKDQLRAEIEELLAKTKRPLSTVDTQNGWTLEAQQAGISFLENIRLRIEAEEQLPQMNLARALDSWGVVSGELLDGYAELSNHLREL